MCSSRPPTIWFDAIHWIFTTLGHLISAQLVKNKSWLNSWMTHADAAHGNDGEGFQDSCCANDPVETQKEDYAQDVLHAGQVNSNKSSHLGDLWTGKQTDTRQQVPINRVDDGKGRRGGATSWAKRKRHICLIAAEEYVSAKQGNNEIFVIITQEINHFFMNMIYMTFSKYACFLLTYKYYFFFTLLLLHSNGFKYFLAEN